MYTLRDYQKLSCDKMERYVRSGRNRGLRGAATGSGKSIMLAEDIRRLSQQRTLVAVHREEIVFQLAQTFQKHMPERHVAIEMADLQADPSADIVVASIATIGRKGSKRLERIGNNVDLLAIDEAHHCIWENTLYRNVMTFFGIGENYRPLLIGTTATPQRGDAIGLENIFEELVDFITIRYLIKRGYLVDIHGEQVETGIDLDRVHRRMGDFVVEELADAVDNDYRNELGINAYLEKCRHRQFLAFAVNVRHAYRLAEMFQAVGVKAVCVEGNTPKQARREIVQAYRKGEIDGIVNVGVMTEGVDLPSCSCIIHFRPTQSGLLYTQMTGRGTRVWSKEEWNKRHPDLRWEGDKRGLSPEKPNLFVIDLTDNCTRHTLVGVGSLVGLPSVFNPEGRSITQAVEQLEEVAQRASAKKLPTVRRIEDIERLMRVVDLFKVPELPAEVERVTDFAWTAVGLNRWSLSLFEEGMMFVQENLLGKWEVVHKTRSDERILAVCPRQEEAFMLAESRIRQRNLFAGMVFSRRARWRKQPATEKQKNFLRRHGVPFDPDITKGEASDLISRLIEKERRNHQ